MFEKIVIDQSAQWEDVTIGELLENLVFFEEVVLKSNSARFLDIIYSTICSENIEHLMMLRDFVVSNRLAVWIDDFPMGEIFLETGMLWSTINEVLDKPRAEKRSSAGSRGPTMSVSAFREKFEQDIFTHISINGFSLTAEARAAVKSIVERIRVTSTDWFTSESLAKAENFLSMLISNKQQSERLLDLIVHTGGARDNVNRNRSSSFGVTDEGVIIAGLPGSFIGATSKLSYIYDYMSQAHDNFDAYLFDQSRLIVELMFSDTITKINPGATEFRVLQDMIIGDDSISALIDDGQVTRSELDALFVASERLRPFVSMKPKNLSLARWYFDEFGRPLSEKSRSSKIARWGVFTAPGVVLDLLGTGGIGTAIGVAVGFMDSLVLDSLSDEARAKSAFTSSLRALGQA